MRKAPNSFEFTRVQDTVDTVSRTSARRFWAPRGFFYIQRIIYYPTFRHPSVWSSQNWIKKVYFYFFICWSLKDSQEAENVVKEVCTEEYRLQLNLAIAGDAAGIAAGSTRAASSTTSAAATAALLQQHLQQVSQQAKVQITTRLLRKDAAEQDAALPPNGIALNASAQGVTPALLQSPGLESMEMSREWIVQLMRCISGAIAPHFTWLTKPRREEVSLGVVTAHQGHTDSQGSGELGAVAVGGREPRTMGATITHWMPANIETYESPMWGGAAALWRCKRDDDVVEDLEEDEVRMALAAANKRVEDMPDIEDSQLGAWKTQKVSKKDREVNVENGVRAGSAEEGAGKGGKSLYVKNREMRPAASLAVRIVGGLKSTAFAHNGMLSSRQGRQRWKKLVCERDLSKFGKSIKSLEENLVWSAVTHDFETVRPQLLLFAERLRSVNDAVKALKLLDGCILDSYRRKVLPRDELNGRQLNLQDVALASSPVVRSISAVEMPKVGVNDTSVNDTSVRRQVEASRRLIAGRVIGAGGIEKVQIQGGRLRAVNLHGRGDDDLGTRGKDIVGKQIRIRTKCDVTGKFRWLDARVLGFEERDKVPFHCLELLDATTLSREPIWMYLKRGNHTLLETVRIAGKRKEKEVVGKQDTFEVAKHDDDIGEGTSHAGQANTMLSRHDPEAQNTQNGGSSAKQRVSARFGMDLVAGKGRGRERGRGGGVFSAARLPGAASGAIVKGRFLRGRGRGAAGGRLVSLGRPAKAGPEGERARAVPSSAQLIAAQRILSASRNRKRGVKILRSTLYIDFVW